MQLSESESHLIELVRLLQKQDKGFEYLPKVLNEQLECFAKRKGHGDIALTCFDCGDIHSHVLCMTKLNRITPHVIVTPEFTPESAIGDSLLDLLNYAIIWRCLRMGRANGKN